jgi:hypothetical protein
VSEKIIRALFGNDAKILQKYTGYTISNLRLAQLNVNIVERDNFLPRLEKVRNTLIDHLNDPTVFETLKKELNLSYKSIDEWKANMTTENILQMVYLKNPELAKKVFPTKSTLRDDIAEYQSVL